MVAKTKLNNAPGLRGAVSSRPSLTVRSTWTPTWAMPSACSWLMSVPFALRASAPVNFGVRLLQMRISVLWFVLTSLLGAVVALLIDIRSHELPAVLVFAAAAAISSQLFVALNRNFAASLSGFKRALWQAATGTLSGVPIVLAIGCTLMYLHHQAGGVKGQSPSNSLLPYVLLSSPALLLYLILGLLTPQRMLRQHPNSNPAEK
jgi:hypothetical protein